MQLHSIINFVQTEHLDEARKSVNGYKSMADPKAGELPHYLLLYYKIIEQKHSKRPSSKMVNLCILF